MKKKNSFDIPELICAVPLLFQEQKFLIGLILMVPVYALESVWIFNSRTLLQKYIFCFLYLVVRVFVDMLLSS